MNDCVVHGNRNHKKRFIGAAGRKLAVGGWREDRGQAWD
jgi:hypothetical protein